MTNTVEDAVRELDGVWPKGPRQDMVCGWQGLQKGEPHFIRLDSGLEVFRDEFKDTAARMGYPRVTLGETPIQFRCEIRPLFYVVENKLPKHTEQAIKETMENATRTAEQLRNDNWHEHGELPPVGWEGQYKPYWHPCEVVAIHKGFAVVWDAHDLEYFRTKDPSIFLPLRTDRERWIEQAIHAHVNAEYPCSEFEAIYDALKSGELPTPEVKQ